MSIIKLSLLILLTKRIIEVSALFALAKGITPPEDDAEGRPAKLEMVADVVLQLTPLNSLFIVLLEP